MTYDQNWEKLTQSPKRNTYCACLTIVWYFMKGMLKNRQILHLIINWFQCEELLETLSFKMKSTHSNNSSIENRSKIDINSSNNNINNSSNNNNNNNSSSSNSSSSSNNSIEIGSKIDINSSRSNEENKESKSKNDSISTSNNSSRGKDLRKSKTDKVTATLFSTHNNSTF